jgi:hypothetical protein
MSHYSIEKNNIEPLMALIDTDKNELGAGSAEVLLGSSLLEQHPPAVIDSRYRGARAFVRAL